MVILIIIKRVQDPETLKVGIDGNYSVARLPIVQYIYIWKIESPFPRFTHQLP